LHALIRSPCPSWGGFLPDLGPASSGPFFSPKMIAPARQTADQITEDDRASRDIHAAAFHHPTGAWIGPVPGRWRIGGLVVSGTREDGGQYLDMAPEAEFAQPRHRDLGGEPGKNCKKRSKYPVAAILEGFHACKHPREQY
jgi:hypothetical protein